MTEILNYSLDEVIPDRNLVLEHQGIADPQTATAETSALCEQACDLFRAMAQPVGMLKDITAEEFTGVFAGDGWNEPSTPVGDIYLRAEYLSLFAATLGARISEEISRRFGTRDLALGCMLDSVASMAADRMAEVAERRLVGRLKPTSTSVSNRRCLCYSPGYCGWHITGQEKLFECLGPERIGITLNDSYLMVPLKSVSGVLIVGPKEIHVFDMKYSTCPQCSTRDCRQRIRALDGG